MRTVARLSLGPRLSCLLRPFSSSAARPAAIPEFAKSSSDELDQVLQRARDIVIIPKHLTSRELKLVFKLGNRHIFEKEPVTATIGGKTVQLQPIDPTHRRASSWRPLKKAVLMAQTKNDWLNIEQLLESYTEAGIKLEDAHINSVVRKAWSKGQHDSVLRMLERAHKTGVRITTPQLLSTLLWGMREIAASNRWARKDLDRALTGSRQICDLLESPEHAGGDRAVQPGDLRTLPLTIGTLLELQAIQHIRYPSKDPAVREKAMDEISQGAARLLNNLKIYGASSLSAHIDLYFQRPRKPHRDNHYVKYKEAQVRLLSSVPVWHAMTLSKRLLGSEFPDLEAAEEFLAVTRAIIDESIHAILEDDKGRDMSGDWSIRSWTACEWVDEKP